MKQFYIHAFLNKKGTALRYRTKTNKNDEEGKPIFATVFFTGNAKQKAPVVSTKIEVADGNWNAIEQNGEVKLFVKDFNEIVEDNAKQDANNFFE